MADLCTYCKQRNPLGGTNHLVLNGGALWIEFCPECGTKETLTNSEGQELTIQQIFDKNKTTKNEETSNNTGDR